MTQHFRSHVPDGSKFPFIPQRKKNIANIQFEMLQLNIGYVNCVEKDS